MDLPSPMVPLNKGMDGERVMLQRVFRDLNENAPMSQDQLKKFLADMDKLLETRGGETRQARRARVAGRPDQGRSVAAPPASVSSNTASRRSGCRGSRPTR